MSNNTNNNRLYTERMSAIADIRAIDQRLGNKAIGAEDRATLDRLNGVITDIDARIQANIQADERSAASDRHDAIAGTATDSRSGGAGGINDLLFSAVNKLETGQSRSIELSERGLTEYRDITSGTAGVSVITTYLDELMGVRQAGSDIWDNARKMVTPDTRTVQAPGIGAFGGAVWLSEASALTEADPTLNLVSLPSYKVGKLTELSQEAMLAVASSMDAVVRDGYASVVDAIDEKLAIGTGSSEVTGVVNAFTGTHTVGGVISPTADNLIAAFHELPPVWRRRSAQWLFSDATIADIRLLKESGSGQYIWRPGLDASMPDTLLGLNVQSSPYMADAGASAVVGALYSTEQYVVRDAGGIKIEVSNDYAFNRDVVAVRILQSISADALTPSAGVIMTNEAS